MYENTGNTVLDAWGYTGDEADFDQNRLLHFGWMNHPISAIHGHSA